MALKKDEESSAARSDAEPLVLVVDDNPANRKIAAYQLERLGCRCHTVANGREAIEAVSGANYDLVLMDCQMPDMDGFETIKTIRQMEALSGKCLPVVP